MACRDYPDSAGERRRRAACIIRTVTRRLALAALLLGGCATAPPPPPAPPPAPPLARAPAPPLQPTLPTEAERLAEAARLVGDGLRLERAAALLAAVSPSAPGRDLLVGQLAELTGDDAGAVTAYDRVLARGPDEEVRLRRALALERLGRAEEASADLRRLREAPPREPDEEARATRSLRPLRPSSR
jgi:hypothetical protein